MASPLRIAYDVWRARRGGAAARTRLEILLLDEVSQHPIVYEDADGLAYVLYPGENAGIYLEHGGNYERPETRFCARMLHPGATAFDVGAHIGLYALLFARLVGEQGRVVAFEPAPPNHRRLLVNLALNGAAQARAEPFAVFSSEETLTLNLFPDAYGAWHSLGKPSLPNPDGNGNSISPVAEELVTAVTLDGYCRREGIGRIDLLKVDVEGAEVDVLEGTRGLLTGGAVGAVLFEVSLPQIEAMGHRPHEAIELLNACGFVVHRLAEDGSLGDILDNPSDRFGNYVAVPRA